MLFAAVAFALVLQCAAQKAATPKATYAHQRDFSQYVYGLHKDPLVLVAFIAAVISGRCPQLQTAAGMISLATLDVHRHVRLCSAWLCAEYMAFGV